MKTHGIHASTPKAYLLKSLRLQTIQGALAGHQREFARVMKGAKINSRPVAQQGCPVMCGILIKIGMEAAYRGNVQTPCGDEGGETQRTFRSNMDDLAAPIPQAALQGDRGGTPDVHLAVKKEGQRGHEARTRGFPRLPWTDEGDLMTSGLQGLDGAPQGNGHPIDLGRVGLRNQGDPHRGFRHAPLVSGENRTAVIGVHTSISSRAAPAIPCATAIFSTCPYQRKACPPSYCEKGFLPTDGCC